MVARERSPPEPMTPNVLLATIALLFALAGAACEQRPSGEAERTVGPGKGERSLSVFAAASLRDVFTTIGEAFEQAHPGVRVTFNFAGTQELMTQVEHGGAPDVFASADLRHMDALVRAGRARAPTVFAWNRLVLVVAREAAGAIRSLADLPTARRIVIGGPEVPVGRYTTQVLDGASQLFGADFRARVEARVVSRELNVRQVLAKVRLGEADAGFVYRTDAMPVRAELGVIELPTGVDVRTEYVIAITAAARHPTLAAAWLDFVRGAVGQRALAEAGFEVGPSPGGAP